jgi:YVTN family beta-propeller protein
MHNRLAQEGRMPRLVLAVAVVLAAVAPARAQQPAASPSTPALDFDYFRTRIQPITLTPDSKTAYVANAGSNDVSVVDLAGLKEVTRIPVGQVPKRNITAMLP